MKITKPQFTEIMTKLSTYNSRNNLLYDLGIEIDLFDSYESIIVDLLQITFDDKESDWIGYFMYELDYGKKWKTNMITDNGIDIPLSNTGELCDFLIKNIEDRKDGK